MDPLEERIRWIIREELAPLVRHLDSLSASVKKPSRPFVKADVEPPPPNEHLSRRWLTTAEAAEEIGVSPKTLANWRALGKGPTFHLAGARAVRYDRDEIEHFVRGGGEQR